MREEIAGGPGTRPGRRSAAAALFAAGVVVAAVVLSARPDGASGPDTRPAATPTTTTAASVVAPAPEDALVVEPVRVTAARLRPVPDRPHVVVLQVDLSNPNAFSVTIGQVGTALPGVLRSTVVTRPWVVGPRSAATFDVPFERSPHGGPCSGGDADLPVEASVGSRLLVWDEVLRIDGVSWRDAVARRLCR